MSWIRRWSTFFRKKIVYILLLVVSFVFAMFQGGFVSWFLFYSFLPIAIYTFFLQIHSMKNVEVRRNFKRDEYSYGDMIEVEITVIRKSAFPLVYLIVEDQVPELFLSQFNLNHKLLFFPLWKKEFKKGIWWACPGTVLVVMALFMIAGYNGTSYYPSTADLQSSLTLSNSSSSEFTLTCMSIVSLIIPFVVAYITYFWRKMDIKSLTKEELETTDKY